MDAKIKELIDQKFWSLLRHSEASLRLFGPVPPPVWWPGSQGTPAVISSHCMPKKERKRMMNQWGSYIKNLGMKRVAIPRNACEYAYVRDPATNWFNAGVPAELWRRPLYIKIPRDLALRILALGGLP